MVTKGWRKSDGGDQLFMDAGFLSGIEEKAIKLYGGITAQLCAFTKSHWIENFKE